MQVTEIRLEGPGASVALLRVGGAIRVLGHTDSGHPLDKAAAASNAAELDRLAGWIVERLGGHGRTGSDILGVRTLLDRMAE